MTEKQLQYFNGDELATNVWLNKYAKKGDETPDDMHKRMAKEFARIETNYILKLEDSAKKVPLLSEEGKKYYQYGQHLLYEGKGVSELVQEKVYNLFKDFKYIVPQGSIMDILGNKKIGSLSNCFVVGQPENSYGGICLKDEEMAQLMKRRGGVGIDISKLQPAGTLVSNAAQTSTGAVSFMHRYSNTTREVAQNGRRGALMISIDINHPDVMEFIKIKRDLTQVTGANISIKLNKEFMEAVEKDEDYILRFPCDISFPVTRTTEGIIGTLTTVLNPIFDLPYRELITYNSNERGKVYFKRIKAKEYWDEIIKSAHNVAEPGLMFWDNMIGYSPDGVYPQYEPITTNPCSEIGMQPYDACRLIAINLFSFVDNPFSKDAKFNFQKFYEVNYEAMRLSDNLIDLEVEHIDRILDKIDSDPESDEIKLREKSLWLKIKDTAKASRRTGLGFTALGDTLAALGLKYDSDEGLEVIEQIMKTKMESELDCSIDLAILRGTFEGWDNNLEYHEVSNDFYKFIRHNYPVQYERMYQYGRRNVSWSTVAPTGTVSLMCQTTSGIEPLFMPFYIRRKKVNPGENIRVDFVDQNGDSWQEFAVLHPKFKEWIQLNSVTLLALDGEVDFESLDKTLLQLLFEKSPWYKSTANDINWIQRVKIQGVIQKYITHSISSTINLPNDVSEEEVSKIYMESWKAGLKGITVYRDGSRSGVLVASTEDKSRDEFDYVTAVRRPKELEAELHNTKVGAKSYNIYVGLMNGRPYEIFIEEGSYKSGKGSIKKVKKGHYVYCEGDLCVEISDNMTDEQAAITRLMSTSLRHGANIKFLVEQLNKCEGNLLSFTKGLARVIKKYIPNGEKSTVTCKECKSTNVIFEEGCMSCKDCGSSKCG